MDLFCSFGRGVIPQLIFEPKTSPLLESVLQDSPQLFASTTHPMHAMGCCWQGQFLEFNSVVAGRNLTNIVQATSDSQLLRNCAQ
eukprot:4937985-Amphidinium_carterae.1